MNFTVETQSFGVLPTAESSEPILEYIVKNTTTGEGFSVIPDHGGLLRQLYLGPKSTLISTIHAPDSPQSLFVDEAYSSAFLYPFPSRVRHGIYRFDGEDYTLPMNEPARNNAIHGLIHPQPFTVIRQDATDTYASLILQYDYAGTIHGYPFPFSLRIVYELTPPPADKPNQSSTLTISFSAHNMGDTRCPAAFGWHPYFTLNNEETDGLTIDMPIADVILLDNNLLPTGRRPLEERGALSLRDRNLDSAFSVTNQPDGVTTVLHSPRQNVSLHVWQSETFGYLVVYTPGRRDSVAIEPLTANVDAFNNGEGLIILDPGEALKGQIKVWAD
ncbi:MAG: aldose 1-epimerase [Cytophagales bacterium]|nr:MAG: aldose 1-epimerase [Cytophagales bacterium]